MKITRAFSKLLAVGAAFFALQSNAQTTILSEGFNNSVQGSITLGGGGYFGGNNPSNGLPANVPRFVEGTHSRGVNNGTGTILTGSINTLGYTNISLSFRLASLSTTAGNGADGTDFTQVEISTNGGSTFSSEVQINGNNNSYWSFAATGSSSTAFDGNNTASVVSTTANENLNGPALITLTNIPADDNLVIRITMRNNAAGELWLVDNLQLIGTIDGVDTAVISSILPSPINQGSNTTAAVAVFEPGVTNNAGQGSGISVDIGYSSNNTNPALGGFTWVAATYASDSGSQDVYNATFGNDLTAGTYFIAARVRKGTNPFIYAGITGTIWNNNNGSLTVAASTAPEINVVGNGSNITDGDTTPSVADDTDFGSADASIPESAPRIFTIQNTGNATLTISDFNITGPGAANWEILQSPPATIAQGTPQFFEIEFKPLSAGTHTATVSITSNDTDESPYTFDIVGIGTTGAPANDECGSTAPAATLIAATPVSGTLDQVTFTSPFTTPDVWYTFTAGCSAQATLTLTTSSQDADIQVWSGSCPVTTTGSLASGVGTSLTSETATFNAVNGTTYRIRVSHKASTSGSVAGAFDLSLNYLQTLTVASQANPAAGNIAVNSANVPLLGFSVTPGNVCSNYTFTGASVNISGTATTTDVSNFRIIFDSNSNGTLEAGELSSPVGTVATLSNPLVFSISGQTALSSRRYFLIADVSSGATPGRTITASLAAAGVTSNATVSGTVAGNTQTIFGTAPVLTAAVGATVDAPFAITFTDNPTWRSNISSITIGGTQITTGFTTTAGQILFTPSTSIPATLLQTSGTKTILVNSTGFNATSVSQTIAPGVAANLVVITQPAAGVYNAALNTQPVVRVVDQYGNLVSSSTAAVTASVGAGAWTLNGTTTVNAVAGVATFSGLTPQNAAAVSNATIVFTSGSLSVTSAPFDLPPPNFIALTTIGTPATENFNSLVSTGTSNATPVGWSFVESDTDANTTYSAGSGSSNSGDTYSFGLGTDTDRAFGGLQTGNLVPLVGARFRNNTGAVINALTISYTGEQWRLGSTGRNDKLLFSYSTTATALNSGTYVSVTQLDFTAPVSSGTAGALNGNGAANRSLVTHTITGLNIASGADFFIRFSDLNASGADDGLGIDDFSLTACQTLAAAITASPSPVCSGANAVFTITGSANATVSYTLNGGSAQTVVLDGSGSGTVTVTAPSVNQTLALQSVTLSGCTSTVTGSATVTVTPASAAGTVSSDQTICSGATPSNITLSGFTGSIQWQSSTDNINFTPISGQTAATLAGTAIGTLTTTSYFRAVVTSGSCAPATSGVVTVTVNSNVSPTFTPVATLCAGDTAPALPSQSLESITGTWSPAVIDNQTSGIYTFTPDAGQCATTATLTVNVDPAPVGGTLSGSNTFCADGSGTLTLAGQTGIIEKWQSSTVADFSSAVTDIANTTNTYNYNGIAATTYFRAVIGNGVCADAFSTVATITIQPNTWTGAINTSWTEAGNWSCDEVPSSTTDVVIAATANKPILATNAAVKSLNVNASAEFIVTSGNNLTVTNAVTVATGGLMTLQNNANLLQLTDAANSGNIIVKRNSSALKRLDYTQWSSPVTGQNLLAFSPLTSVSPTIRFYTYNTLTNLYNSIPSPGSVTFQPATGYQIRMPNNHPTTATIWPGSFTGVPHNGNYTFTMVDGGTGNRYNLVGNPYPSPISMTDFVAANQTNITGTIYFWRKTNNAASPSYCSWNNGTFVDNGEAQVFDPEDIIRTGQGFIIEGTGAGTALVFTNSMRVGDNANQFFRMANQNRSRIWLNATHPSGAYSQTAIVYVDGAQTDGIDAFDGKYNNDGEIALTTTIGSERFAIQGRSPFVSTDVVPLEFTAVNAGEYQIALDKVDGIFEGDQQIYLRDNANGAITNLKEQAYTFTAEAGTASGRFDVIYDATLNVSGPEPADAVKVLAAGDVLTAVSPANDIVKVTVYDLRGRQLASAAFEQVSTARMDVSLARQVLLVQIELSDGTKVSRKIMN